MRDRGLPKTAVLALAALLAAVLAGCGSGGGGTTTGATSGAATTAAATTTTAAGGPQDCGALSVGKGGTLRGSRSGPACMLRAYQACRPAIFRISGYSFNALVTEHFTVARAGGGGCTVKVVAIVNPYPQPLHTLRGRCKALREVKGGVVAVGCSKTLPAKLSLSGGH